MRLHAEIPLIALARLTHVAITPARRILGRTRYIDDGRVDNGAARDLDTAPFQMLMHGLEQPTAEIVALQQMPKVADGRLVGHQLAAEINANETAHRMGVVE
jgi:hypothetical protein